MSKRMSRENQKLIYWFIDCYAYHLKGVDINWQTSKQKPAISDYFLYKAKEDLKKLYIRHSGKNVKGYEPFKNMESKLKDRIGNIIDKNYTKESKINIITNDLMDFVTDEIQMLFIKLNDTFSLALKLMSNTEAVAFTNFLFDYFLQNDIAMWEEMQMLYKQQNEEKYIYAKLKYKRCAVCNRTPVDLHHYDNVNSIGGYSQCNGLKTRFMSLCREHHNLFHSMPMSEFEKKYQIQGIWLNPQNVYDLLKVYPNHFELFKKEYKEGKYGNLENNKRI